MDIDATTGEATAPRPTFRACRFCQTPVSQPKRRDMVKDFCSDRHRAAFRDAQVQHAIQTAQDAMAEAGAEFERLAARLTGAADLLERYRKHGSRPRPAKQPAEPSQELTKALAALLPKP